MFQVRVYFRIPRTKHKNFLNECYKDVAEKTVANQHRVEKLNLG